MIDEGLTEAEEMDVLLKPCDTCGTAGPEARFWDDDTDAEQDTEVAQWLSAFELLGAPRCWNCSNPLVREAIEAPFVEMVMESYERQTPAIRKLAEDRLALKAMRERVDGGRPGTWLASGEFVEADQ